MALRGAGGMKSGGKKGRRSYSALNMVAVPLLCENVSLDPLFSDFMKRLVTNRSSTQFFLKSRDPGPDSGISPQKLSVMTANAATICDSAASQSSSVLGLISLPQLNSEYFSLASQSLLTALWAARIFNSASARATSL